MCCYGRATVLESPLIRSKGALARLKSDRWADMPVAYSPVRVPSAEDEPQAKPDAQGVLARLKGLEPLTHCLEGSCSIHLSYRRVLNGRG